MYFVSDLMETLDRMVISDTYCDWMKVWTNASTSEPMSYGRMRDEGKRL